MVQFDSKLVVLFSLMTVAVVGSDNQYVQEKDHNYTCCDSLLIPPNEHCETTWSVNGTTIDYIEGSDKAYIIPCQKVDNKLGIRGCVDCTAHNVYRNGDVITSEEIIHYKAQPCQQFRSSQTRPLPQGHVYLLLVAFLIIGFFTNC